jgi:hypothetical protein
MKPNRAFGLLFNLVAAGAFAQVNITGQESADKAVTGLQISVSTMDRTYVPLTVETKQTKVDASTTRSETATRARLNDGSFFDFRNTTATTRQRDPNTTETVIETVENDRQGGSRATRRITAQTTKTATGEQSETSMYRRDSSGKLILDGQIASTTTKNPDGSLNTVSVEKRADMDGAVRPQKQIEQTTTPLGENKKRVVSKIMTVDHLAGGFGLTSRETATVYAEANTTRTEKLIQKPSGAGWQDIGRIVTTETRDADGSVRRETIEEGRSLYTKLTAPPMNVQPLVPQRKVVEREVRNPDGSIVMKRDVFRRDVNGEWKPVTFSTEAAAQAAY